jgi:hypothetical protein
MLKRPTSQEFYLFIVGYDLDFDIAISPLLILKYGKKKLKLYPCPSLCTSINSKWIKDLNIRPKTLKLLQEGAGNTLELIGIGKDFLNRTPADQQLRERMDKWDFIKLKSFCTTKEMVSKLKNHPHSGRKYLLAICQTKD